MIIYDTDTCIEILRGNRTIAQRQLNINAIAMLSFMTVAELYYGAYKSSHQAKNLILVDSFVATLEIIESSVPIMVQFGIIKSDLEKTGRRLADADLMIAACAIHYNATLITGNEKHFSRISNLKIDNWIAG